MKKWDYFRVQREYYFFESLIAATPLPSSATVDLNT